MYAHILSNNIYAHNCESYIHAHNCKSYHVPNFTANFVTVSVCLVWIIVLFKLYCLVTSASLYYFLYTFISCILYLVQWSLLSSLHFLLRMSLLSLQLSCQRSVREFTIISNLVILTYLYCESHAHGSSHSLCASSTHRSTEYPTNFPTSLYPTNFPTTLYPYVIPACSFVPCAISREV